MNPFESYHDDAYEQWVQAGGALSGFNFEPDQFTVFGLGIDAVSYTHLTLPTKA